MTMMTNCVTCNQPLIARLMIPGTKPLTSMVPLSHDELRTIIFALKDKGISNALNQKHQYGLGQVA